MIRDMVMRHEFTMSYSRRSSELSILPEPLAVGDLLVASPSLLISSG
jgi:hypothetical protein